MRIDVKFVYEDGYKPLVEVNLKLHTQEDCDKAIQSLIGIKNQIGVYYKRSN